VFDLQPVQVTFGTPFFAVVPDQIPVQRGLWNITWRWSWLKMLMDKAVNMELQNNYFCFVEIQCLPAPLDGSPRHENPGRTHVDMRFCNAFVLARQIHGRAAGTNSGLQALSPSSAAVLLRMTLRTWA
jgi:hypothetical protein